MNGKTPILLTLTRVTAIDTRNGVFKEEVTVAHPNNLEAFGAEFVMGMRGGRAIVRYNGEKWHLARGNNTAFFKNYDKLKKGFWPVKLRDGEYWFDDVARVVAWNAMWK